MMAAKITDGQIQKIQDREVGRPARRRDRAMNNRDERSNDKFKGRTVLTYASK